MPHMEDSSPEDISSNSWAIIEPDGYYESFISQEKRPDLRGWTESRTMDVRLGAASTAEGSATVRLGSTTVVCGVKAELTVPGPACPNKGMVVPNVEIHPCSSPRVKLGPPSERSISCSLLLNSIVRSGHLLDLEQLCPVPNEWAWCLYIDVVCINDDGNVFDAAVMAMTAALCDVTLPELRYDEETKEKELLPQGVRLQLKDRPLCTTFGIYNSEIQLVDPTSLDEQNCSGLASVVMASDGSLVYSRKAGGAQVSAEKMDEFVRLAAERLPGLQKVLLDAQNIASKGNK